MVKSQIAAGQVVADTCLDLFDMNRRLPTRFVRYKIDIPGLLPRPTTAAIGYIMRRAKKQQRDRRADEPSRGRDKRTEASPRDINVTAHKPRRKPSVRTDAVKTRLSNSLAWPPKARKRPAHNGQRTVPNPPPPRSLLSQPSRAPKQFAFTIRSPSSFGRLIVCVWSFAC
jgi:hypothetical protein